MESSKFPKAIFKGNISDYEQIDFNSDGEYPVIVSGEMTIHGVTKEVETEGLFKIQDGKIQASSSFEIAVTDYDIKIPAVVKDNIAKIVKIDVHTELEELVR